MPKENPTLAQEATSGCVAAVSEVLVNHPFWTIKTRRQQGMPFTLSPRVLYSGFFPNMASMMPITAAQMGSFHVFQSVLFADSQDAWSKAASGFSAGAVAAMFAGPVEMVMTHQEPRQRFVATAQALMKQGGVGRLYTGCAMTAMRDGGFTVGYIVAPEVIKPLMQPYFESDKAAVFWSKIVAGVGAAVASQPFDTIKTAQQSAAQSVTDAIKNPFKGGLWRGVRVVSAVYIMSSVKENMNTFFKQNIESPDSNVPREKNVPRRGFSG